MQCSSTERQLSDVSCLTTGVCRSTITCTLAGSFLRTSIFFSILARQLARRLNARVHEQFHAVPRTRPRAVTRVHGQFHGSTGSSTGPRAVSRAVSHSWPHAQMRGGKCDEAARPFAEMRQNATKCDGGRRLRRIAGELPENCRRIAGDLQENCRRDAK